MQFVLLCQDIPNTSELREANTAAHLDYLREQDSIVLAAGPLLDDQDHLVGSMLVVDVATEAAAWAFLDNTPFAKAGLFAHREIRRWRWVVKSPKG